MIPALTKQLGSGGRPAVGAGHIPPPTRLTAQGVRPGLLVTQGNADQSPPRPEVSGGWKYYGRKIKGGWVHYGDMASGAAKYYDRKLKGGWGYYGGRASGGWKYYRDSATGAWRYHFGTPERYRTTPEDPWMDSNLRMDDGGPIDGPWYGHYLGPSPRTQREYDRHYGQDPVTPVDAAAKRHDEEYDAIQNRYGMYKTYGDPANVWFANYVHPHSGLHLALAYADAALVWRSWWGIGQGLFSGEYDLTFTKGSQGWANLLSDIVWGLGITFLYAGPSAMWHLAVGLNPYVIAATVVLELGNRFGALGGIDYYSRRIGDGARYYGRAASGGWNYYTRAARGGWDYYGGAIAKGWGYYSERFSHGWDTSTDIAGGARYYGRTISGGWNYYSGAARGGWEYYSGRLSGGWKYYGGRLSAGWKYQGGQISRVTKELGGQFSQAVKQLGGQLSSGAKELGRDVRGGWDYYGGKAKGGWDYYGGKVSGGWKYHGGQLSRGAKQVGGQIKGGWDYYGGKASSGWKSAGGKLSDGWKKVTGGGGGGGCFLTTACDRVLSTAESHRVLTTLRAFRDQILLPSETGAALVREYYTVAPRIVNRIDASPNRELEYARIYYEIVLPTYNYIRDGDYIAAVNRYSSGVMELMKIWFSRTANGIPQCGLQPELLGTGPNGVQGLR